MDKQALEIMALAMPVSYSIGRPHAYGTLDEQIEFNTSGATAMYNPGSHMAGCTCPLCASSFEDKRSFESAEHFEIGPGIAREMPGSGGLIERYRYDQGHSGYPEPHLNYEIIVPSAGRSKPIIDNHHIDLDILK